MNSLGKLNVSRVAVQIENTLALVNINLDFSLWRCAPSPEYHPVGLALTLKRKHEAEKGEIHRTACKLGFLFHELVPETPRLFKTFGSRVPKSWPALVSTPRDQREMALFNLSLERTVPLYGLLRHLGLP